MGLTISIIHFLAVTEIYILEDTAPGTVIYRAAAKDPEDAVLEVIYGSGQRISVPVVLCMTAFTYKATVIISALYHNSGSKHTFCLKHQDIFGENV